MNVWTTLGLRAARLEEIEREFGPFEPPRQPNARMAVSDPHRERERERTRQVVEQLRAQEPVERIVNALLLSAIQEGAERLTIAPDERGVRVLLLIGERERQHLHLPTTTLEPLVQKLRAMAELGVEAREGRFRMMVEKRGFLLRVWMRSTRWGERVEVAFSPTP